MSNNSSANVNKVFGFHEESNTKVELESGFSFISFDGTRYVVGGWEKNKKTGAQELAVFEAVDDKVYLGKEDRVPAGEVLELAENPLHTIQFDWQYIKAKVETDDSYQKGNPDKYAEMEEVKKRMEVARKENERRKQELSKELEKGMNMEKSDAISQVESYDRRPKDKIERPPSDEVIDKKVDAVMDDLIDMQEELARKIKDQPMSKAVTQIVDTDDDEEEDDDSYDDDDDDDGNEIEDIDAWLAEVDKEVSSKVVMPLPKEVERKTSPRVSVQKPIDVAKKDPKHGKQYRKEAKRLVAEIDEEVYEHMNSSDKTLAVDELKRLQELEAKNAKRFADFDDRIKRVQEELQTKSFRQQEASVSNPAVEERNQFVCENANDSKCRVELKSGEFGTRIAAVQNLNESKIIENAQLINFICEMDEDTKKVLLTIASQMRLKNGKCNIFIM